MTAAFPALGFDPAPGDPGAATELASTYAKASGLVSEARELMGRATQGSASWTGSAGDAFRGTAGEAPAQLAKATSAFEDAGATLRTWSADLAAMQVTARSLEAQAADAKQRYEVLSGLSTVGMSDGEVDAAKAALSAAAEEFEQIRRQAQRLLAQHGDLASQVSAALKALSDQPIFPPWFNPNNPLEPIERAFDQFFDQLGHELSEFGKGIHDFVKDNANAINEISNVVSDLATVTGAVGLGFDISGVGAPVGAVLGVTSAALSGVALAGHSLAAWGGAKGATKSAVEDAFGLTTFGISRVVGRVATKTAGKAAGELVDLVDHRPRNLPELWDKVGQANEILGHVGKETLKDYGENWNKYWNPLKPEPLPVTAISTVAPLVRPFYHAWEIGHKKDLENR